MKEKIKGLCKGFSEYVISIGVFLIIWGIYVKVSGVAEYIMPSPMKVLQNYLKLL